MKTQHNIKKLEDKLNSFLMSHDIKIGMPISTKEHAPLLGCEYDSISHTISLVVPSDLKTILIALFRKQELDNIYYHIIKGEVGYIRIIVYL